MGKVPKVNYICPSCGKTFSKKSNLDRHVNTIHLDKSLQKIFICYHCNVHHNNKSNLVRHISKCANRDQIKPSQSKNVVLCSLCSFKHLRANMLQHYSQEHCIKISIENIQFNSFTEFLEWKETIEKTTVARYVICNSSKTKSKTIYYYRCHRDGHFKSRGKNLRKLKIMGSNKLNGHCPSRIDVTLLNKSGELCVKFVGTHVGHKMELERIPLKKSERDIVATKLAQKMPFDEVITTVKEQVADNKVDRLHLLTRKDLFNIKMLYNLNDSVKEANDCLGVESWIQKMNEYSCDSVIRFYKQRDRCSCEYPNLSKDDFLLIIMNNSQLDLLKKYSNKSLCIDTIRGASASNFELTTVSVFDDVYGYPCLFVLSSRTDYEIYKVVFDVIKINLGTLLNPSVLMTEMCQNLYSAWCNIMGPPSYQFVSSWSVLELWKKHLGNSVKDRDTQTTVLKLLQDLLEEENELSFEKALSSFVSNAESDPDLTEFLQYFTEVFYGKRKCWGRSYLKHSMKMSVFFERIHFTMRSMYSQGKRLDKVINNIMKFVKDRLHEWHVILNRGKASAKSSEVKKRHKSIETSEEDTTIEVTNESWTISSEGNKSHMIKLFNPHCTCEMKCTECQTCIHRYMCSCPDSSLKWNMCKHIHMLCQHLASQLPDPSLQDNTNNSKYSEEFSYNVDIINDSSSLIDYNPREDVVLTLKPIEEDRFEKSIVREKIVSETIESPLVEERLQSPLVDERLHSPLAEDSHESPLTTYSQENGEADNVDSYKARLLHTFESILQTVTTTDECSLIENTLWSLEPTLAALGSTNIYVLDSNEQSDTRTLRLQGGFLPIRKENTTKNPILKQLWREIS